MGTEHLPIRISFPFRDADPSVPDQPRSEATGLAPTEVYRILIGEPDAVLVDVRNRAEWTYAGTPDLSKAEKAPLFVSWLLPSGEADPRFVGKLHEAGVQRHDTVVFMCRTGSLSRAAACAASVEGFVHSHYVEEGYEGPSDPSRRRGIETGWVGARLPTSFNYGLPGRRDLP